MNAPPWTIVSLRTVWAIYAEVKNSLCFLSKAASKEERNEFKMSEIILCCCFVVVVVVCVDTESQYVARMSWILLCSPGSPQTPVPPTWVFLVLGLQVLHHHTWIFFLFLFV